jgi:hypothetical protein
MLEAAEQTNRAYRRTPHSRPKPAAGTFAQGARNQPRPAAGARHQALAGPKLPAHATSFPDATVPPASAAAAVPAVDGLAAFDAWEPAARLAAIEALASRECTARAGQPRVQAALAGVCGVLAALRAEPPDAAPALMPAPAAGGCEGGLQADECALLAQLAEVVARARLLSAAAAATQP